MNDEMDRIFELCDLVPAIVQDDGSGEVIMLAYMNRESFRKSFETGEFWHFDRARGKLSNLAPSGWPRSV